MRLSRRTLLGTGAALTAGYGRSARAQQIVIKFMAISKEDQRKIKKYLRDLNGQIESHIVHLADKTKKDQNYNQKIIEQMLRQCMVNIQYQKNQKKFTLLSAYQTRKIPTMPLIAALAPIPGAPLTIALTRLARSPTPK